MIAATLSPSLAPTDDPTSLDVIFTDADDVTVEVPADTGGDEATLEWPHRAPRRLRRTSWAFFWELKTGRR